MAFMKDIAVCWRCANLYRTARFEPLGFSCWQYSYILNVCAEPGIAQDRLAKKIYVHKSNAARQLASLEEKGFVERRTDATDKRVLRVYPTQKAERAVPEIRAALADYNAMLLSGFSPDEVRVLESMTARLAENARRVAERLEESGAPEAGGV